MTIDRTLAISTRIIHQITCDHRSLALIIVAPVVLMSLVGFSFADRREILDLVAPGLIGTFVLFFVFLLTGVSFLRERAQGTIERLLTTPVGRADILVGYLLGFLLLPESRRSSSCFSRYLPCRSNTRARCGRYSCSWLWSPWWR